MPRTQTLRIKIIIKQFFAKFILASKLKFNKHNKRYIQSQIISRFTCKKYEIGRKFWMFVKVK